MNTNRINLLLIIFLFISLASNASPASGNGSLRAEPGMVRQTTYADNRRIPNAPIPDDGIAEAAEQQVVATSQPQPEQLVNPLKGKVFNQRCRVYETTDKAGRTTIHFDCVEDWASKPLPGGCSNQYKNYLGSSSCNLAATSFVINMLADPEVIRARVGKPYITPDVLAYDVYPNLPGGEGIVMDCSGASANTIKAALALFGIETRDIGLSFYTVADKYRTLEPDELLMLSYIGINIKGRKFQHWNVASGTTVLENGHETVTTYDSFFYLDANNPNYDTVVMEVSPNITPAPGTYTGKNYNIVGAMAVKKSAIQPDISNAIPFDSQAPILDNLRLDPRFIIERQEWNPDWIVVGEPVEVGPNRYRREVRYFEMEPYNAYYSGSDGTDIMYDYAFAFRWKGYVIPLMQQDDPKWGGMRVKTSDQSGNYQQFAPNGCAPTLLASLLSMYAEQSDPTLITPFGVIDEFIPAYKGKMFANDAKKVLDANGFLTKYIPASWINIGRAVDEGKIVMIQSDVDFKWVSESSVTHYILVLGRYGNGSFIIYDPLWGFATTKTDILFTNSSVFSVDIP